MVAGQACAFAAVSRNIVRNIVLYGRYRTCGTILNIFRRASGSGRLYE
ncbi:hypothetical protein SAMN05216345_104305 [Cupriavidus sp. YR651]|nr:hypothetical protein SAMN05216345_104305 [Cupriavidus sp. YR651]